MWKALFALQAKGIANTAFVSPSCLSGSVLRLISIVRMIEREIIHIDGKTRVDLPLRKEVKSNGCMKRFMLGTRATMLLP